MKLPIKYNYLLLDSVPLTIKEGMKLYGTKEIVGPAHNRTILEWAKEVGIDNIYKNDETAWCGLAMAIVMKKAGKNVSMKGYDLLRALQWQKFGQSVATAGLGDILVFQREGGGHVALYVGEDEKYYHCLGGNQSNAFNITRIEKKRCVAIRRPLYKVQPKSVQPVRLTALGEISRNEA